MLDGIFRNQDGGSGTYQRIDVIRAVTNADGVRYVRSQDYARKQVST